MIAIHLVYQKLLTVSESIYYEAQQQASLENIGFKLQIYSKLLLYDMNVIFIQSVTLDCLKLALEFL